MPATTPRHFERNLVLYPVYSAGFAALAWIPVFFLYFLTLVPLEQVLALEAIYYVAVVVLEVPSGCFSDAVGRRPTLMAAAAASTLGCLAMATADGFGGIALGQLLLALAMACNSGTDSSFHYDSLVALGRAPEFSRREAATTRTVLAASGAAAILGGVLGTISLRLPYVATGVGALLALGAAAGMAEPPGEPGERRAGALDSVAASLATLRQPSLRWLFVVAVVLTVLNHVPYELYQPYVDAAVGPGAVTAPAADSAVAVPALTGLLAAAALLLGAAAAPLGPRIAERLGTAWLLLTAAAGQVVVIGLMGLVLSPWMIPVILLRVMPRALTAGPYRGAVLASLRRSVRATWLSVESFAGRLAFGGYLAALAALAGDSGTATSLLTILRLSAVAGAVALAYLAMTRAAVDAAPRNAPAVPAIDGQGDSNS